jgi:hypothetical protein
MLVHARRRKNHQPQALEVNLSAVKNKHENEKKRKEKKTSVLSPIMREQMQVHPLSIPRP